MNTINAIAQILSISENQVVKTADLPHVYSVVFRNLDGVKCCTFVSKRKIDALKPYTTTLYTSKRQRKAWLAKIVGTHATYRFEREFLEPVDIDWGKRGMNSATFAITESGMYHDSDDDYFVATKTDAGIEVRYCSKDEIEWMVKKQLTAIAA